MKRWKVTFEVYRDLGHELKTINVEAGTKKLAATRAMISINKIEGYSELFKKIQNIEEVI